MVKKEFLMSEEPLKLVIQTLTLDKIQKDAIEDIENLLMEGFYAAKENNFPAYNHYKEIYKEVVKREGLIDAWLSFICLCIFAQGVSVGRGKKEIEKEDISITKKSICDDEWPHCSVMRLKAFSKALDIVIKRYEELRG